MQAQMMQNPEMMRAMFDNPMVQNMLSNPELMQQMISSNPMVSCPHSSWCDSLGV